MADRALIERLPSCRGLMQADFPLAPTSWFRTGGNADVFFRPADSDDLSFFLQNCPDDVPLTFLGACSNCLIRDGGVEGVVIKLSPSFAKIKCEGDELVAGAAAVDLNVARAAQKAGVAGFSFLSGIPGTIGGALRMNAGAYGREVKDALIEATVMDRKGARHRFDLNSMQFGYRSCGAHEDLIFLEARFKGSEGSPDDLAAEMLAIKTKREAAQPIHEKTSGSTFANPDGHSAWKLIDEAGCRGLRIGGAMVSEKHCNFLINCGDATGADLETLGEEVRARVEKQSGISLRWEIKRLGRLNP